MKKELMQKYAECVVRFGANVQKGQFVNISCSVQNAEFARLLSEEAYKAEAAYVRVEYFDDEVDRLTLLNAGYEAYLKVSELTEYKLKFAKDVLPVSIYVEDSDPDGFNGIDQTENRRARMESYPRLKPYYDYMENRYQWVICAMPSVAWAKKVFPDEKEETAFTMLEEAILKTTRIDETAVENWKNHVTVLQEKARILNEYNFDYLEYKSSNGTDLKLHLMPRHCWLSARETTLDSNIEFTANMPTEEVFTMPKPDQVDGRVVSTKPLSYRGKLIEDFEFTFKDGKVVDVKARTNQDVLEDLIKEDEASARLGEAALVPYDSPISTSGILFYNTLFDENASCHLALGSSFKNCLRDYENVSDEEWEEMGYNDSMNHVDFMIGSKDLEITGTTFDGKKIPVFKNGNWAI